ncbi:hypothetical protein PENTCL1PPCAC_8381 [Pristionchus entomophagus]|uniref:Uncharacterized protein n=1 Tax=Pristionchus entomophagus TaxID=358040 RepID=A0AAV5SSQ0_9BILA|nr:hypothetical protein PENTCL1PPCAC_8381 [Pristionchus entomophagus]
MPIIFSVADFCQEAVERELWKDFSDVWEIVAKVLVNAMFSDPKLFEGPSPTVADFKDSFIEAAEDERKPYELFVLVLKHVAVCTRYVNARTTEIVVVK